MNESNAKPIIWIGSSFRDLKSFPREVEKEIGYALWVAQQCEACERAKWCDGDCE